MSRILVTGVALLAAWLAPPVAGLAGEDQKPVPEFGGSISFDPGDPQFRISDLRGKLVIVIFFQSWCPKCNAWSGGVFSQTAKAYGDDRSVALVAIKSDGGGPADAKRYLSGRTDLAKWLVLGDRDYQYQQQVVGNQSLYQYMVLDPKGNIAEKGQAGSYYTIGGKDVFSTAMPTIKEKFGADARPVLPGKEYAKELAAAVAAAELRSFKLALTLCSRLGNSAALQKDILAVASEGLDAKVKTLKTAGDPGRFEAFMALRKMADDLNSTEPGRTAASAVNQTLNDTAIAKELSAERDYNTLAQWAAAATPKQRQEQMPALLERLAKLHEGTFFGARAATELKGLKK